MSDLEIWTENDNDEPDDQPWIEVGTPTWLVETYLALKAVRNDDEN